MENEGACDVSISGWDGDEDVVSYSERVITAPDQAECCECGRRIEVGEKVSRFTADGDDSDRFDVCAQCNEVISEFCDGHNLGTLWEEFEYQWDDGAHVQACLNRLRTVAAKRLLHSRWLAWKGLNKPQSADAVDPSAGTQES